MRASTGDDSIAAIEKRKAASVTATSLAVRDEKELLEACKDSRNGRFRPRCGGTTDLADGCPGEGSPPGLGETGRL
jgi:hypothetical protein